MLRIEFSDANYREVADQKYDQIANLKLAGQKNKAWCDDRTREVVILFSVSLQSS